MNNDAVLNVDVFLFASLGDVRRSGKITLTEFEVRGRKAPRINF